MWKPKIKVLLTCTAVLLLLAVSVLYVTEKRYMSCQQEVLSAQAIDQATNMYAAQSALEALQRGDIDVVRTTLEEQVRQGLVILRATRPQLTGKTLSDRDRKTVDDAMQQAERYAREHNLQMPSSTE